MSAFCRPTRAAQYLGCSADSVYRWIRNGTLPAERVGRNLRVLKADVRALRRKVLPAGGPVAAPRAGSLAVLRGAGLL